ncbi:polymorphic toxin type 33 domain-containing protein [Clostridium sp. LS]|uniref:polymorphic toxin type 33 domain-containing protein n=1 Tax=unclassified Clostridium TaxID=2614128 RepID=UPI000C1741BD
MVNDKYLKKQGIDAHSLKQDFVGKNNIAHYDIYVDKETGMLWIYRKGGKGEPIPTYEYIK